MFISEALGVTENGVLSIGGADAVVLARKYGTPLYVMDEEIVRRNMRAYRAVQDEAYSGGALVLYASKAFCCKEICRIAESEGLGLDVVSGGELYTALAAGMPAERICMHGNNKSVEEMTYAVRSEVGRIVADSEEELEILDEIAEKFDKTPRVLLRVKPGIEAHTHEFIQTGQEDSKFGVSLQDGTALRLLTTEYPHLHIAGVHCHIGSQIFENEPFEAAAERMMALLADVREKNGTLLTDVNLGGGLGIRYTAEDTPKPYDASMRRILAAVQNAAKKYDLPLPFLLVEPGRSIVGEAGVTLYRVGTVKDIPGVRKYVAVDGGMADNPRYILYQAQYEALAVAQPTAPKTEKVTVCGKCCESGDIIIKDGMLPPVARGDLLAVLSTGAYNYSMSSRYNRLPRPAVVMVRGGESRVIVRRESYADLVRNDE